MGNRQADIKVILTREDERLVNRVTRGVVQRYQGNCSRDMEEELHHYGLVGLIEAKRKYDKEKGIPFPAFAVHRIKGAMIDHLRTAPMIRVPQKQQELRRQVEEARRDLEMLKVEVTEEGLAGQLGWPVGEVQRVLSMQTKVVSLNTARSGEEDSKPPFEERELPSDSPTPEAGILTKELAVVVQECLKRIRSARDRMILVGRVLHDRKLREIADCLECSMETVRLRQKEAVDSMKRCMENHGWSSESLNEMTG